MRLGNSRLRRGFFIFSDQCSTTKKLPCGSFLLGSGLATEGWAAIAVAITAVYWAVCFGFEGKFGDGDSAISALKTHGRDVEDLAGGAVKTTCTCGTRSGLAAIAVAVTAVDWAVCFGLEGKFVDGGSAISALKAHG